MHANYFCFQTNYGHPSVSKHLGEKTLLPCCCFYLIDVIVNLQWSTYNSPLQYQCKATQTGDENIREIYQLTKLPWSIALSEKVLNNIYKKNVKKQMDFRDWQFKLAFKFYKFPSCFQVSNFVLKRKLPPTLNPLSEYKNILSRSKKTSNWNGRIFILLVSEFEFLAFKLFSLILFSANTNLLLQELFYQLSVNDICWVPNSVQLPVP